jgi:hypothetical protein
MKPLVAGNNITITEGTSQFTISSTSDPQVNADWDATSGVQEILNKPNLSTVATTGQYADLLGKPDIPASTSELVNDSGFITASEAPVQDVKVDGSSVVDGNGVANISIPQFQQLNSDWDATSGVQEILNRPEVKPLVAGSNITITETPSSVEIAGISSSQLNADWDATSGVQEILNKPDLSIYAEKSDLATVATTGSFNDLVDKPTIPSAQVNADWDATSGVSEILNRPNLATVATTGDYSDLQNLPSIPAAQVNSDWSATSGVQEILNKPTVKQVVAGSNITITETASTFEIAMDTPIPSATSDLINDSGFVTLSDLPPEEVEVLTYGTSTIEEYRAALQAGKKLIVCRVSDPDDGWRYVMQSVSSPFPEWSYDIGVVHCQLRLDHNGVTGWTTLTTNSTTSADAGKVFTVDQYGRQVWASGGGGGGSQVNADWDATSGVAEILNKPTPKTLTAGANISISEGQDTLTISAAAGLPASTSADEGKCLVVDSNGDPEWGTGGKTYTGTDGVVVDNVNDTVGLEAPVDLVGGPGITVDNPDGNTVRISYSGYNETLLWSSSTAASSFTLSEIITNFERLKILMQYNGMKSWCDGTIVSSAQFTVACCGYANNSGDGNRLQIFGGSFTSSDGKSFASEAGKCIYFSNGNASIGGGATVACTFLKIYGVNRIAND